MDNLRVFFERAKPSTKIYGDLPKLGYIDQLSEIAVEESPFTFLKKSVLKKGRTQTDVFVIIVDAEIGFAFIRKAYNGADNTLYVGNASTRRGAVTGQGSTVSELADFVRGTEGRPLMKLLTEKGTNDRQRYHIYGVGRLMFTHIWGTVDSMPLSQLDSDGSLRRAEQTYWGIET